jgi:hypothetical protein
VDIQEKEEEREEEEEDKEVLMLLEEREALRAELAAEKQAREVNK